MKLSRKLLGILIILALIVLPFTLGMISAELPTCSDTNELDIDDIPCVGLTVSLNCSENITALNSTDASINFSIPITPFVGNISNFTINLTEGGYELVDCANNTATIIIGDFGRDDLWKAAVMIGLLGMAYLLIIMGRVSFEKDRWLVKSFLYVCGILITIVAVQAGLIFSRVDNIDSLMGTTLLVGITIISVIVMYLLVHYTVSVIKNVKEAKRQKEND